ncbi:hypothetical protein OS122_02535 [Mycolicibacterium mucogenicum]|uniref:hypothetical protein n=1 Tax=Mycolicibacterium mucogenicum TaxID=56689 RepID=UPI00226AF6B6|nr:hypothetical protein [Mycolicibacterium mucogenicum]MCX8559776.1 hypothetical protein [Mycolicibacterium mucogenicum]
MADPLASAADVASELGLTDASGLTPAQTARIPGLLTRVSWKFRRAADRQFTPGNYTQRLQVVAGRVRLPEDPVTSVESVVDDAGNTVIYTLHDRWLDVSRHHTYDTSFMCHERTETDSGWFVTASYTGGEVPDEVTVTVAQIVARLLGIDPTAATGVRSVDQSMGPFAERKQFFDWAAETVAFTDEEQAFAESFRYQGRDPIIHRGGAPAGPSLGWWQQWR